MPLLPKLWSIPCAQAKEHPQREAAETPTNMSSSVPLLNPLPTLRDRHGGGLVAICPIPPSIGLSPSSPFPYIPTYPVRQARTN